MKDKVAYSIVLKLSYYRSHLDYFRASTHNYSNLHLQILYYTNASLSANRVSTL